MSPRQSGHDHGVLSVKVLTKFSFPCIFLDIKRSSIRFIRRPKDAIACSFSSYQSDFFLMLPAGPVGSVVIPRAKLVSLRKGAVLGYKGRALRRAQDKLLCPPAIYNDSDMFREGMNPSPTLSV